MTDTDPSDLDGPTDGAWPHRLAELTGQDPSPRRAEMWRLADAARRVLHGLVMTDADDATISDAADRLEELAARFDTPGSRSIYEGFAEAANSGTPTGFFDHSPMLGRANPLAPPITLEVLDDRTMQGTAVFGSAYEGPPGCVHGGYVAAAFDEVLGSAQSLGGQPGMTARLAVDYRSPTPLHEALRFVGAFDRVEGRKIFTTGAVYAGERLCAEAQGLFVSIDPSTFRELREARSDERTPGPG